MTVQAASTHSALPVRHVNMNDPASLRAVVDEDLLQVHLAIQDQLAEALPDDADRLAATSLPDRLKALDEKRYAAGRWDLTRGQYAECLDIRDRFQADAGAFRDKGIRFDTDDKTPTVTWSTTDVPSELKRQGIDRLVFTAHETKHGCSVEIDARRGQEAYAPYILSMDITCKPSGPDATLSYELYSPAPDAGRLTRQHSDFTYAPRNPTLEVSSDFRGSTLNAERALFEVAATKLGIDGWVVADA